LFSPKCDRVNKKRLQRLDSDQIDTETNCSTVAHNSNFKTKFFDLHEAEKLQNQDETMSGPNYLNAVTDTNNHESSPRSSPSNVEGDLESLKLIEYKKKATEVKICCKRHAPINHNGKVRCYSDEFHVSTCDKDMFPEIFNLKYPHTVGSGVSDFDSSQKLNDKTRDPKRTGQTVFQY